MTVNYALPSLAETAAFAGVAEAALPANAAIKLQEASDLLVIYSNLRLGAGLTVEYTAQPEDTDFDATLGGRTYANAVMQLALGLMAQDPLNSGAGWLGPYQSETIGSWSYSRRDPAAVLALFGGSSGLHWLDAAIMMFGGAGEPSLASGIEVLQQPLVVTPDGQRYVVGPADVIEDWRQTPDP